VSTDHPGCGWADSGTAEYFLPPLLLPLFNESEDDTRAGTLDTTPEAVEPRAFATLDRRERSLGGLGRVSSTSMKDVPAPQPTATAASFNEAGTTTGESTLLEPFVPHVPCSFQPQIATAPDSVNFIDRKKKGGDPRSSTLSKEESEVL
jgi:hypothetical protein